MHLNDIKHKKELKSLLHSKGCTCKSCNGNTAVTGGQSTNNLAASLGTLDELANYLESGYFNARGRISRKFNLASKSKLTYNTTSNTQDSNGVSPERSHLIEEAFKLLEATLGFDFQKTNAAGADFRFGDSDSGAYNYSKITSEGEITYSEINIATSWHSGSTSFGDYVFQTTLHEIGHALGLGHPGNYNGSANYPFDTDFINDSWHTSMMSYFNQTENTSIDASYVNLSTPMVADWIALDDLYSEYGFGINNAFTEDTIYGFDTNIGEATSLVFNSLKDLIPTTAYTIVDGGGNDTLDLSGFSATQLIDLRPSDKLATNIYASNIGGKTGNLSFAPGTLIESVVGGSGADTFHGNNANNKFDGRDGDDSVFFSGELNDYSFSQNGPILIAHDLRNGSPDGQDTLVNIEFIDFNGTFLSWNELLNFLDTSAPTIEIYSDSFSLKVGESASLTFTLSEASTDFVQSDVNVSGGVLSSFSGSGTTYTATFTPTADSTTNGVISVASNQFSDAAGNTNNDGSDSNNSVTLTVDTVRPTIAISSDVSALKAGETAALTFTLSEASTNFIESDVTVSGGSLSNWTAVSNTVYTATFTPTADSTTNGAISVASNQFSDAAGNTNNDGSDSNNSVTLTVDTVRPTIAISSQIGSDIDGEAAGDLSGYSVSLSSDGSVVAISALTNDGNGSNSGHVRLYAWNGSAWVKRGVDIDGEAAGDLSGTSVSLSSDGSVVAIGAYGNDGNGDRSGHVRLYEWNGSAWVQRGSDIDGEAAVDYSGVSVSLSGDGSIVAIGADLNDGNGNGSGHVRLYEWNGSAWVKRGSDIDGEAAGDLSGYSVSLSSDGSVVAISAPYNGGNGDSSGHVRLYAWNGSAWVQRGSDIDGEAAGDLSGYSVSLSSDGSIVAISAPYDDGNGSNSGHVRLYEWNGSAWVQRGSDIDGEAAGDECGWSVSLSSDGSIVAISAHYNDGNGSDSGHVRLYEWNGSAWVQRGSDIDGEAAGDQSGGSVSLSSDGSVVAISAPYNDGNGDRSGHVRIFDVSIPTIAISSDVSSLKAGETAALTFNLSEASTDFVQSDVTISGGSLSNWTAVSSTVYTATFTPTADSTTNGVISVASNQFSDAAGNTNNDGSDLNNTVTLSVDTVSPTIAISSDVSSLKAGETSALTFNLSEASTNFIESDVTVSGGSLSNWTAVSSTVYTATFTPTADSTTNGVISVASNQFSDAAENTNNDGSDSNNSVTLTVDTVRPTIAISSQIGSDIDGEAAGDYSGGYSVSLSSDGSIVAIGALYNDGNGSNSGHTRLYAWDGSAWVQRGSDIEGEAADDHSGYAVSLSSDGSVVAIGAFGNDGDGSNSGHVRLYEWNGSAWVQRGSDIDGEATGDLSGGSVSLSADGSIVAIGADFNDGNGSNSGHVRLYAWNGSAWVQRGSDIDGEAAGDQSGWSVSLSSDGSVVAIGAYGNDGNGSNSGQVRLYEWNGSAWVQRGSDIDGEAADDYSSYSVSLSSDGSVVAIGAHGNDGNGSNSGHVRLYEWNGSAWVQRGSDIDGEAAGDSSGLSVSLSSDGSIVAIGAPNNDGNGSDSGQVRLYEWNGSAWVQRGGDIDGEATGDQSGGSVSLSSDGSVVAIGAYGNDGNGSNSGHVRIFNVSIPTIAISSDVSSLKAGETAALTFNLSEASTNFVQSDVVVSGGSLSNWTAVSSTVYTATFTPTVDSSINGVISVASNQFSDAAGNTNNDGSDLNNTVTLSVDTVSPTIAISSDVSALKAGETSALTFSLSEASTNFIESDVTVSGGSLSNWTAVSSTVYTATFTPTADSTTNGVISVASNQFSDAAENTNNDGSDSNNSVTLTVDTVRPTIAISSDVSSLTAGESASLTFTLSEASTNFVQSDVTISGGVLSSFSGSGTTYTATFTPTADSTTNGVISVASNQFYNAAGNTNNDGSDSNNSIALTIDTVRPNIAISSDVSSLTAGESASLTFTLSEASTDFVQSDVTVSGGVLSSFSGSGTTYTATFTPTADSTTNGVISVASNQFSDAAGNTNNDGSDSNNTVTLTVDTVRPTIAISSDVSSLKAGETAALTFNLSEASTNFVQSDVVVSGGSLSNWTAVSSTVYTATFTPTVDSSINGVISVASNQFSDAAGNTNNDGSDSNNTVTLTVDTVRPTIAISSDVSALKAGETAALTFTLSEASTNFVQSDVTFSGGVLSSFSGSGTTYTATFTPTADSTTNGVISVASNQFSNAAGNTNNDGSDSNNSVTLNIDTVRPTIAISSDVSSLKAGETSALTFTLSEASTNFVQSDVTFSGGVLSSFSGSGTTYTATFTPTTDSTDNAIISVRDNRFSDASGNFNIDNDAYPGSLSLPVDTFYRYVHRVRESKTGKYLYATSQEHIDIITGQGWIDEGIMYKSPGDKGSDLHSYDTLGNGFFYTANEYEKSIIDSTTNWIYGGVAFQVYTHSQVSSSITGLIPVYRYLNSGTGLHLYSASSYEQQLLNETSEWLNEGLAWYGEAI